MGFLVMHWHCILPVVGLVGYFILLAVEKRSTSKKASDK